VLKELRKSGYSIEVRKSAAKEIGVGARVVCDLFWRERRAHGVSARRVADAGRIVPDQKRHPMSTIPSSNVGSCSWAGGICCVKPTGWKGHAHGASGLWMGGCESQREPVRATGGTRLLQALAKVSPQTGRRFSVKRVDWGSMCMKASDLLALPCPKKSKDPHARKTLITMVRRSKSGRARSEGRCARASRGRSAGRRQARPHTPRPQPNGLGVGGAKQKETCAE